MKNNNYIIGKHIFLQHPNMQQKEIEKTNEYYKRKKKFFKEANLLSRKKISFREITQKEIEKSINNIHQVVFEVTEKCNLNCVYCAYGELYSGNEERIKVQRNLKKEDAISLLEYLYPIWQEQEQTGLPQKINIGFYGGEPLLNFSLIETIVQWTKERSTPQIVFGYQFTTNGLLLHKYIVFLVENDFIINLSLDGDEENMSYRVDHHGENCFNRVFDNIMAIKKEFPDYFEKNVIFLAVLHNKNSVEQVCNFCMTHFSKIPICSNLTDNGVHPQKRYLFTEMHETNSIKLSKKVDKARTRAGIGLIGTAHFLRIFSGFHFYDYNNLLLKEESNEVRRFPAGACIPFSREIFMTINGNLYPCERLDACYTMGNIHNTPLLDVAQIASRYNQYFKIITPTCTDCERNFSCSKCLFHIDDIQGTRPQCNKIMNHDEFSEMFFSTINASKRHPELYRKIMKNKMFVS
jgi:uncharacterized protein